jgi:hypothetical protein
MATRKFSWIAEGDVFGVFTVIEDQNPEVAQRLTAGLLSNPIVVETTGNDSVAAGWTYDGTDFHPPAE